jgi:enediyne biosynthesis protein E7
MTTAKVPVAYSAPQVGNMAARPGQIPPRAQDECRTADNLLFWMDQQLETYGDIFKASLFGTNVYAIRDPEFAHHVLVRNWQNYVRGPFIKRIAFLLDNGLIVSEGELWKRQRRMMQPAFRSKPIGALTKLIVTVNSTLLKKWQHSAERRESVNVTRDVSGTVLEVVLRSILDDDYEQTGFHFNILAEEPTRDLAFAQAFRALGKPLLQVVERRRKSPSPSTDIMGMLMQVRDLQSGQMMPDRQLINEILTLIVAGHETTASTLNWTWYLISQHPEVQERLSNELNNLTTPPELDDLPKFPYLRQIIEEAMRLYPALWLMTRKALRDDRLGDYFVPAGTEIYISPYFIQRHPDVWDDPDRFNPDRFGPDNSKSRHRLAMIPFAAGPRNCIGESFARLEMQIHLLIIAERLRLRYVHSGRLELDAGVNLRSKYDFIMYPIIRNG